MSCQVSGGEEDKNRSKNQCLCIIACHPVKPLDKVARGLFPWKSRFVTGGKRHLLRLFPKEFTPQSSNTAWRRPPWTSCLLWVGGVTPKCFPHPFPGSSSHPCCWIWGRDLWALSRRKMSNILQAPVLRLFPCPAQQTSPCSHSTRGPWNQN